MPERASSGVGAYPVVQTSRMLYQFSHSSCFISIMIKLYLVGHLVFFLGEGVVWMNLEDYVVSVD